jgi:hypothetical protein
MRPAFDQTRERPTVAFHASQYASEVETVARVRELFSDLRIDRNIGHQGAPDRGFRSIEDTSAHTAAGAVGPDEQTAAKVSAISVYGHVIAAPSDRDDTGVFDQNEARVAGGACEP